MKLLLVGIGTGNPNHMTLQAVAALKSVDVILVPRKGVDKADLADLRFQICESVLGLGDRSRVVEFDLPKRLDSGDYLSDVSDWHDAVAHAWTAAFRTAPNARSAALMIWGDPSLYDSALRIARRLEPVPDVSVVPGITALQALTAAHAIPLNTLGAPVMITTGRRLRESGWPAGVETLAVMLDGTCAFCQIGNASIWWGAYLGMADELLVAGSLPEIADEIVALRRKARARHGWIMDSYILRR